MLDQGDRVFRIASGGNPHVQYSTRGELLERTEAEVPMDQTPQELVGRDAARRVAWCAIIARLIWGVLTLYEVIDEKLDN